MTIASAELAARKLLLPAQLARSVGVAATFVVFAPLPDVEILLLEVMKDCPGAWDGAHAELVLRIDEQTVIVVRGLRPPTTITAHDAEATRRAGELVNAIAGGTVAERARA